MTEDKKQIPELTTEVIEGFSENALNEILKLERSCFSKEMQYDDAVANEYYTGALKDEKCDNIFLKENDEVVGYVLSVPHNRGFDDIFECDPEFKKQENFYYVETIQVLPEKQGRGGAKKLLIAACEQARKRGIENFSIHARKINGLSGMVKKLFEGKITKVREIEHWEPACGEPYEYIEWKC